jgi:polysaccharide deacetylase family protein (PEP-CTERM system associated)
MNEQSPFKRAEAEIILSFDVEEHFRIEAAAGLVLDSDLKAHYGERLGPTISWLLGQLESQDLRATFFIVGEIALHQPELIRMIHRAGHEVASHSWDHRRLHNLTHSSFREDVRRSKDVLEQITGEAVLGYRAPTFSIVRQTAWALDVLADLGLLYDSSIYPVWHDRYGVPDAPRAPFLAEGRDGAILEIPPATLRLPGVNIPVGGGGYFRLLPLPLMMYAIRQVRRQCQPPVTMLYFHPWEFDPEQPRLPLRRMSRFRTYVGINHSRDRLTALLRRYRLARAIDVARRLKCQEESLPRFKIQ